MRAKVGMKVKAYREGSVGLLTPSTEWQGEIIKVNRKSIRVQFSTRKFIDETTSHEENLNAEITFKFAKTLSNGHVWYKSEGYLYGSIEI